MKNMNDEFLELCGSIVVLVAIILMCAISGFFINQSANKVYNHGICECGGNLILDDRVGHRYTTDFYYHCDRCGVTKVIEANEQPK